jgi:hypothetical protein
MHMAETLSPKRDQTGVPGGGSGRPFEGLEIPTIPDDLREPVSALVNSSVLLKRIVEAMASGHSFKELARDRLVALMAADTCVEVWRKHLGIETDDDEVRQPRRRAGIRH